MTRSSSSNVAILTANQMLTSVKLTSVNPPISLQSTTTTLIDFLSLYSFALGSNWVSPVPVFPFPVHSDFNHLETHYSVMFDTDMFKILSLFSITYWVRFTLLLRRAQHFSLLDTISLPTSQPLSLSQVLWQSQSLLSCTYFLFLPFCFCTFSSL